MTININGTTGISGVDGSAGTPAIQGSDTNTGVFFGTNTIDLSTDGTSRLSIGADGDLNVDSGTLFVDASTDRVGIGTSSPTELLHVAGNMKLEIVAANNATRSISARSDFGSGTFFDNASILLVQDNAGSSGGHIEFQTMPSGGSTLATAITIDDGQRVGIGTISPGNNLEISCDATDEGILIKSSTTRSALRFDSNPSSADQQIGATQWSWNGTSVATMTGFSGNDTTDKDDGYITFAVKDSGLSIANRLRINPGDIWSFTRFGPWDDNVVSLGRSGGRWTAVWATNGTIQTSDQREKTEITNASLGSDFIKSLRPVSYKWIEGGKRDTGEVDEKNNPICEPFPGQRTHWGFIAQEVKQAVDDAGVDFGGWVLTDKDDPDSQQALRYDQFIAPLTKALQEALAKIETLEARLSVLEGGAN
jgi:hypothetical protein